MDNFNASFNDRFASVMAVVDAWALDCAGCDCRAEAEAEVLYTLADPACSGWADWEHAENAINAWVAAE